MFWCTFQDYEPSEVHLLHIAPTFHQFRLASYREYVPNLLAWHSMPSRLNPTRLSNCSFCLVQSWLVYVWFPIKPRVSLRGESAPFNFSLLHLPRQNDSFPGATVRTLSTRSTVSSLLDFLKIILLWSVCLIFNMRFTLLTDFKVYNAVLLTTDTVLYRRSLEFIRLS